MTTRRTRVADAAIEVLGTQGVRHLTHRAVDAAAGLPLGSTSNVFRTREALLVGVLRRMLERESAAWTRLAAGLRPATVETVADTIGRLLVQLTTEGRVLTQARRAVFVEAASQPALQAEIASAQEEIGSWMAPLLAELGSPDPAGHVHHLLALMDGLAVHQLTNPRADFAPTVAIAALLRGLVSAP